MAGSKTDTQEATWLDYEFRAVTYTVPGTWYVALFTAAPTDAGGGTEVTGGSYARVAQIRGTTAFARTGSVVSNAAIIAFPTATAGWGTIVAWALFDAATVGTMRYWGDLAVSRTVLTGDPVEFAIGALTFTED
jgi:hypothetical protein